jgi:cytochrome c
VKAFCTVLGATALLGVSGAWAAQPSPAQAGRALYLDKCGGCHAVDANGIAPMDRDLVGRPVAALTSYRFSPALQRLGGFWTPERLDAWMAAPQAMAPGSTMATALSDPAQRRAIIVYLATVSDTAPEPLFQDRP